MTEFNELHATLKFNTVYVCACCGKRQVGTTVHMTYQGSSPNGLRDFLNKHPQQSKDMPMGWCFDGKFKCPTCFKGTQS